MPQGVGPDGASHAPAAKHVHRTSGSVINKQINSTNISLGKNIHRIALKYLYSLIKIYIKIYV